MMCSGQDLNKALKLQDILPYTIHLQAKDNYSAIRVQAFCILAIQIARIHLLYGLIEHSHLPH